MIQCALDSIACTGKYTAALGILRISGACFKQWRDRDPELAERVRQAKEEYYLTSDYTRKRLARSYALKALNQKLEAQVTETRYMMTADGEIEGEIKKVSNIQPPRYLVEGHLFENDRNYAAVRQLALTGKLPQDRLQELSDAIILFDQRLTEILEGERSAIARIPQEQLVDAATRAIQRLVTQDSAAIPAEVANRPESSEDSREV
jgi:hypothetical protein